jgi:hypothetical protein
LVPFERMTSVPSAPLAVPGEVEEEEKKGGFDLSGEIVELNVGGVPYTTCRHTLTRIKGSVLDEIAQMSVI